MPSVVEREICRIFFGVSKVIAHPVRPIDCRIASEMVVAGVRIRVHTEPPGLIPFPCRKADNAHVILRLLLCELMLPLSST